MSIKGSGKNATRLQNSYIKRKYDRILLLIPKESGLRERIQTYCTGIGQSVNSFIINAILSAMEGNRETEE